MRPIPLAAFLALGALPAAAEPRQFGNVVYDLPPLWSQGRAGEGAQVLFFDGDVVPGSAQGDHRSASDDAGASGQDCPHRGHPAITIR